MDKKTINKVLILTLSLAMLIIPGARSHAENINNRDVGYNDPYLNMYGVDPNSPVFNYIDYSTDEFLSNIYWVDLVKKNLSFGAHVDERNFEMEKYMSAFPKYITLPTDTAVNTLAGLNNDLSTMSSSFYDTYNRTKYEMNTLPVSGIVPSVNAMYNRIKVLC